MKIIQFILFIVILATFNSAEAIEYRLKTSEFIEFCKSLHLLEDNFKQDISPKEIVTTNFLICSSYHVGVLDMVTSLSETHDLLRFCSLENKNLSNSKELIGKYIELYDNAPDNQKEFATDFILDVLNRDYSCKN